MIYDLQGLWTRELQFPSAHMQELAPQVPRVLLNLLKSFTRGHQRFLRTASSGPGSFPSKHVKGVLKGTGCWRVSFFFFFFDSFSFFHFVFCFAF